MAVPIIRVATEADIYSPFTGQLADDVEVDSSVVLVHYGDAGEFAVLREPVINAATDAGIVDPESLAPADLLKVISIPNSIAFEVDTGWNGVNYYIFRPNE